ncbi:SsgA family sporulation/cell division regulator [Streptomyces sp. NPDC096136]|uniref:SsgA family sporulation/cell division regulator n=1 Tax=Streptomyces sp. NPDC096136 TaxID=3366076 RepID=UPI003827C6EE
MSATAENPPATSAAVEERVSARVISDDPLFRAIPVALRFTTAEPLAIRIVFPAELSPDGTDNEWVFPRTLLEAGLLAPTGTGDVRVWPCGRVQAVVEFHSPDGVAVLQFDSAVLRRFLRRTYATAAAADAGPAAGARPAATRTA